MTPGHAASPRARAAPSSRLPARFRSQPPVQARSRETMDRFAAAVEELLQTRRFEDISIQDIVRKARRPIGSFYARFGSREALLPHLYRRYHERLESMVQANLGRVQWESLDFPATVTALADFLIRMYDDDRGLIRAVALFARTHPDALPADIVAHRRRIYEPLVRILVRHQRHIVHPDPEAAARFALFLGSSVAREKILFGDAPHSRVTPMTREELRRELVRSLHAYLTYEASR